MSDNKKPASRTDANRTLSFRLTAVVLVLYWLLEIVRAYMAGGPDAPSTLLLVVASVVMGGGAVLVALLSFRTWKKTRDREENQAPVVHIRLAKTNEFEKVRAFYHALIDLLQDAEYKPAWRKGIYPSDEYLKRSLENGELWVCEYDSEYAAAMILNHESKIDYKNTTSSVTAEKQEISVIHALGVLTAFQGRGLAGAMLNKAIEIAQQSGQKAIRLDVLCGNIPAEKLYQKHGFQYVETARMFYEDTGWTDFKLYEYVL